MRTPSPWSLITLPNGDQIIGNQDQKLVVCLAPNFPLHNAVAAWKDNAALIVRAPDLERDLKRALEQRDEAIAIAQELGRLSTNMDANPVGSVGAQKYRLEQLVASVRANEEDGGIA